MPTTVTTPTHALTVTVYGSQVLLGVAYLVGLAEAKAMTEIAGPTLAAVWALCLLLSSLTALVSVVGAKDRIRRSLAVEMWAALAVGLVSLIYEVTLLIGNGPLGVVTTQTYALAIGIGCLARAWQIRRELARIRRRDE